VKVCPIGLLTEKTNSIIMVKRKITIFLPLLALLSSFVLLTPSLSPLLPPLVEEATAQTPPRDCSECIVIEYEGWHAAVISGIESFANTTTQQEQYNWYLWEFVNSLVSDGYEIKAVTMDDIRYEDDDSTEHMYRVVLGIP
jgi:hypothetical protein